MNQVFIGGGKIFDKNYILVYYFHQIAIITCDHKKDYFFGCKYLESFSTSFILWLRIITEYKYYKCLEKISITN